MSSLEKMLGLLDVFTTEQPIWSSEDLIQHLGAPASTCYRYLKVLHTSGYLARVANGSYVLGPRIMELNRVSRESDPVYIAGSPIAQRLTHDTGYSTLLCMLFSDSVMCVHRSRGRDMPEGLSSRGRRRPLVAGASAKVILAHLPMHQLRILYAKHTASIAGVGLGDNWDEFKASLKNIRQQGFAMTIADCNVDVVSIAAPLFNAEGEVLGSLALAASNKTTKPERFKDYAGIVIEAAKEVTDKIASNQSIVALPARAIG